MGLLVLLHLQSHWKLEAGSFQTCSRDLVPLPLEEGDGVAMPSVPAVLLSEVVAVLLLEAAAKSDWVAEAETDPDVGVWRRIPCLVLQAQEMALVPNAHSDRSIAFQETARLDYWEHCEPFSSTFWI